MTALTNGNFCFKLRNKHAAAHILYGGEKTDVTYKAFFPIRVYENI